MGKADIYQVAKEAGVSISTVSRAFTRPELVSAKTRRKVLDVADKRRSPAGSIRKRSRASNR